MRILLLIFILGGLKRGEINALLDWSRNTEISEKTGGY